MSKKREATLREALDACQIILDAAEWLDEKVATDIPTGYRYASSYPVTREIAEATKQTQMSLERQLGRELHKAEPDLFGRLLKAKCEGRG